MEPGPSSSHSITSNEYVRRMLLSQEKLIKCSQEHMRSVVVDRLASTPENPTVFHVGDYVLLSYPERPPSKLSPKWRGPLIVVAVDGNTYDIQDLCTLRVERFDISRLKLYRTSQSPDELRELASRDREEHVVEFIVAHAYNGSPGKRHVKSKYDFQVRWLGYGPDDDIWLPYSSAKDLEALDTYIEQHPELRAVLGGKCRELPVLA